MERFAHMPVLQRVCSSHRTPGALQGCHPSGYCLLSGSSFFPGLDDKEFVSS